MAGVYEIQDETSLYNGLMGVISKKGEEEIEISIDGTFFRFSSFKKNFSKSSSKISLSLSLSLFQNSQLPHIL